MNLAEKIADLKIKKKVTTEELSSFSGVPIGTINKLLNGETQNPTAKTLGKIALALGCTVEYLYGTESDEEIQRDEFEQALRRLGAVGPDGHVDFKKVNALAAILEASKDISR